MRTLAGMVVASAAVLVVGCSDTGPPRVGCLQKDDSGNYVLNPIASGGTLTAVSATEQGQGGKLTQFGASEVMPHRSFRVVSDKPSTDLSQHVNQRVAVSGFIEEDRTAIATGTAGPWQNDTGAGYGSPSFNASPATIGDGSASQIGTRNGTVGTSGYVATNSGSQTEDRVRDNRSTDPTSGGGIVLVGGNTEMPTLRAESIRTLGDSCSGGR
jgi:hypothetical protein